MGTEYNNYKADLAARNTSIELHIICGALSQFYKRRYEYEFDGPDTIHELYVHFNRDCGSASPCAACVLPVPEACKYFVVFCRLFSDADFCICPGTNRPQHCVFFSGRSKNPGEYLDVAFAAEIELIEIIGIILENAPLPIIPSGQIIAHIAGAAG